jgi:hypothetical protein
MDEYEEFQAFLTQAKRLMRGLGSTNSECPFRHDSTFVNATGVNSSVTSLTTDGQNLYYVVFEYSGSPSYPNIGIWKKPLAGGAATQVLAAPFIQSRMTFFACYGQVS